MLSKPETIVTREQLAAIDDQSAMAPIPPSRMFEIRKALAVYTAADPDGEIFDASQGDGGASIGGVDEALLDSAFALLKETGTAYTPPAGHDLFRRAVAEDYWQLDADGGWGPDNVIACQGGRDALLKAYDAIQAFGHHRRGDFLIVSAVPWISYRWGSYAVGANALLAPGDPDRGWALTADAVAECLAFAESAGRRVSGLVITSPDNPTGRYSTLDEQTQLARAALSAGVPYVIFDWIYHQVTDKPYDINRLLAALDVEQRERCIVLDGITKSLGASNIRNAHLLASTKLVKHMQARASHGVIPSFFSQAVAVAAYRKGRAAFAKIVEPTNQSRQLMAEFLRAKGLRHVLGQGYYAFIDVAPYLAAAGCEDSIGFGRVLAERFGLAVVPGSYFSHHGDSWVRFSYALSPETTRGATERLWQALSSF